MTQFLGRERHAAYERAAECLCSAALEAFVGRRDPTLFTGDSLQQLVQGFPLRQDVISGNARFDFLERGDDIRLVEMNFVGVGTVGHSLQATRALISKSKPICASGSATATSPDGIAFKTSRS